MQIISYVGGSQGQKNAFRSKKFLLKLKTGTRGLSRAIAGQRALPSIAFPKIHFPRINVRVFLRPARLSFIAASLALCILVPYVSIKVSAYLSSFTGPLRIEGSFAGDLELLDSAMGNFAMQEDGANVDENGNVLSDDGKILTASSVGLGKAVSYETYKVKSGDTISSIALKFGLTNISTLISVNGIDNVRTLRAGQKLRIPNQDGISYTVEKGASLSSVSAKYKVSVSEIVDVNELADGALAIGQELFIPGARMDSSALRKAMGELFVCPISAGYRISSYFGRRADPFTGVASSHTGIDLACPMGTPINASMSGKVVYVGWSNIFGNYVIINHGNGYQTLYGHMSKTLCRTGQTVGQGTRIGLVGSTGYSTGPHLHFTVYKNGKLVDPLSLIKR